MGEKPGEGTAALEKAIDVLEAIGDSPQGLGHVELAARLALPRTTVYRILATLVARGMVWRDPLRRVYCLGSRTIELARKAYSMPDLVAAAAAELRALRDVTGETSYLAALDGYEAVSLERCEGAHNTRSATVPGQRKPLHCTSQGKAMLSAMDAGAREAIVRDLNLRALTEHTITDRRRFKAELKATMERGYAIDDEEIVMGVRCVGAPIVDSSGKMRGAVSVAGPAYRLTMKRLQQLGPEVAEAARRIGAQLGITHARTVAEPSTAVPGSSSLQGSLPRWSARQSILYWADRSAPAVRRHDGSEDVVLAPIEAPITGMVLHREGVMVAHERGWNVVDAKGKVRSREGWPGAGLRALAVRPGGELWAAMKRTDDGGCNIGTAGPSGGLAHKWHVDELVESMAWSADGETLYGVAAESGSILVMQSGSRSVRRLATMPKGSGRPAGLALDADGGIWTALVDGWSVVRFSADGNLESVVALPVPHPTDVAFGGPGLATLFVTSARASLSSEILGSAPLSGRLFEIELQVKGIPEADIH